MVQIKAPAGLFAFQGQGLAALLCYQLTQTHGTKEVAHSSPFSLTCTNAADGKVTGTAMM